MSYPASGGMSNKADKSSTDTGQTSEVQSLLDTASKAIFKIKPKPLSEKFESYSISSHQLANLSIYLSESDPFVVRRRSQDIEDDSAFDFLVLVQLEGNAEIEQEDISFMVEPDTLVIIPGGLPYDLSFLQTGSRLLLRIPLQVFHERILGRQIRDFGVHVYSGAGLVQITIDLLKSLVKQTRKLEEMEQYTVSEATLELLAAVLRSDTGFDHSKQGSTQVARMSRILSYLEENYADCEMSPAKVASANAVSTRHLHNLFQHSGTTVTKWIWERRLKAARNDILNPVMIDKSITEIAYSKGFNDSAHFSRAFKARFGMAPSKLRKKVHSESAS